MTPTRFIARFHEFKDVPSAVLNDVLCEAIDLVGTCWGGDTRTRLIGYLAAHILASQGHGHTVGIGGVVKRRRVGDVETEFLTSTGNVSDYDTTSYGKRYLDLLRRRSGGVGVLVV